MLHTDTFVLAATFWVQIQFKNIHFKPILCSLSATECYYKLSPGALTLKRRLTYLILFGSFSKYRLESETFTC